MSLKLLLFPTLLVLGIILIVGYIKPDIVSILDQREQESAKQQSLQKVEGVANNIQALTRELNDKGNLEALVKRYVPVAIDQERSLDIVNFLAQQTGVTLRGISVLEEKRSPKPAPVEVPATDGLLPSDPTAGGSVMESTAPEPSEQYAVQVDAMGTYANLRNFYDRLYRTDRWRVVSEFTLMQPKDIERFRGDQEVIPADHLLSSITFTFPYLPSLNPGNALSQELFQKDKLDFGIANQLNDFVNSPVGDLSPGNPGRSNPFEALP